MIEHVSRIVQVALVCAVAIVIGFWGPWRAKPVVLSAPTSAAPVKATNDIEAAKAALDIAAVFAAGRSVQAPAYAAPAVTVVRDAAPAALKGLSDAEIATILHGLSAPMAPVYRVSSALVAPSPAPSPAIPAGDEHLAELIHAEALRADQEALATTKIDTHVTVDQVERPPARVSSLIGADGASGIAYALKRNGQLDLDLAAVTKANRLSPALAAIYRVQHTSLGVGPIVSVERGKARAIVGVTISL